MGVLSSKVHAQEIPAVFANDSLYHRYGTMYSVDNLPKASYHNAKQRGIPLDSLRWLISFGGTEDSVRVFAAPEQIRVNKIRHIIIEKTGFETKGSGASMSDSQGLACLEDGALLFYLGFKIDFRYKEPRLCRYLSVNLENFDPSFTHLEFRNVNARVSPYCLPDSLTNPRRLKPRITHIPAKERKAPPAQKHNFYSNFCIEGEIHGERILPDGSYRTGKLYDFRMSYERSDGYIRGYIKPHAVE